MHGLKVQMNPSTFLSEDVCLLPLRGLDDGLMIAWKRDLFQLFRSADIDFNEAKKNLLLHENMDNLASRCLQVTKVRKEFIVAELPKQMEALILTLPSQPNAPNGTG